MWVPFSRQNAERRQSVGAPLVGALPRAKRREKTIGRGTPCGCPSQGQTPRTVQIIVRNRKFSTSFATGGRFLVLKRLTIGRGAPCGRPLWAIVASESKCDCPVPRAPPPGQLHQIRKNLVRLPESGRGAPCGRPSWAIVASESRCDCPILRAPPRPSADKKDVLRGELSRTSGITKN